MFNTPNTCSMMSSQDKMTQYTNFYPHQSFELQDQQPRPSNKNIWKPTITIISDLNSNCQLPKPGDRSDFKPPRPVESRVDDERPTEKKHTTVGWDDGGKIGKIIN